MILFSARQSSSQDGAALVEAAYTLLFFFVALFSLMHFALAVYRFVGLQHALATAGRFASLGNTIGNLPRAQSIKHRVRDFSSSYGLSLQDSDIRICPADTPNCTVDDPGDGGELIRISASQPIELFKRELFTVEASVTVLNENF